MRTCGGRSTREAGSIGGAHESGALVLRERIYFFGLWIATFSSRRSETLGALWEDREPVVGSGKWSECG